MAKGDISAIGAMTMATNIRAHVTGLRNSLNVFEAVETALSHSYSVEFEVATPVYEPPPVWTAPVSPAPAAASHDVGQGVKQGPSAGNPQVRQGDELQFFLQNHTKKIHALLPLGVTAPVPVLNVNAVLVVIAYELAVKLFFKAAVDGDRAARVRKTDERARALLSKTMRLCADAELSA